MTANLIAQHARSIVENCPFPMLLVDKYKRVLGYNRAFAELVGPSGVSDLLSNSHPDAENHPAGSLLGDDSPVCWTGRHGTPFHFDVTRIPLDGTDAVHARIYVDITRQVELESAHASLNEELQQNVLTDNLTGLLNQRGVVLALEPQVARSRRYNSPMAVILMETSAPERQDEAHLQVARLLKDQLRWADLIGCNQRREFILVLPETSAEAAVRLADKISQRVRDMSHNALDGLPIETCYGVTSWRRSDNAETLLSRAGGALAQARSVSHTHAIAL